MAIHSKSTRKGLLLALVLPLLLSVGLAQTTPATPNSEDATIANRIESFKGLSPDAKAKLSLDLQGESKEHFGFEAIKSVDDLSAIDIPKLTPTQKSFINLTTMHVVDKNLVPIAVLKQAIKPTGIQIYPDLQALVNSSVSSDTLATTGKVGRIRYWVKNGQPAGLMQDSNGYPAGTGFVIGPGMIATACHVLDYITDQNSVDLSPTVWVKIDFSAAVQTHQAYLVSGILGRGSMQGQDYAILAVSSASEDGAIGLPDPMTLGADTNTQYVGVIGYPDFDGAAKACGPGGTSCDETNKWFSDFAQRNPGVIKIISPGRKTGDFSPHGFPILTYDAPTLEGQSGSPVIDLESGYVIGLHYCCTGYKPNDDEPSCAKLQPISLGDKSDNEALSIKNIVIPH
jgi:hypothetical protein